MFCFVINAVAVAAAADVKVVNIAGDIVIVFFSFGEFLLNTHSTLHILTHFSVNSPGLNENPLSLVCAVHVEYPNVRRDVILKVSPAPHHHYLLKEVGKTQEGLNI